MKQKYQNEERIEEISEIIMPEKLMSDTKLQIQEAQERPNRINAFRKFT